MGRGDRYLDPKFTVPMTGKGDWPFPTRQRPYCGGCGRPNNYCECDDPESHDRGDK